MASSNWLYNSDPSVVAPAAAATVKNVPGAADKVLEFFSSTGPIRTSLTNIDRSVQKVSSTVNGVNLQGQVNDDIYKRLKYQYANLYVATAVGGAANTLGGASENISKSLNSASRNITETLKPVSSFIGSTLYTLTSVLNDPLGSVTSDLPNTVGSMMDKLNPSLKGKYQATFKKFNIDKLSEMPGQLFGSIQQFVRSVDGILSVPVGLISDIYRGLMDLISQVSDFINSIFEMVTKFVTNIIDQLLPGVLDFLTALTDFANQIGGITSIFSGSNQILGFTNQLISGANQLNSFIQNPLDLAFSLAPQGISQNLYLLQNPQQIINQYLPPELSEYTQKLSSITGFGFNGNMGFGLGSVLQGLQNGVLSSILQGFSTQFSILAPIFTGASVTPQTYPNQAGTVSVPGGPSYNVDNTGSQIVQTTPPKPNYQAA
jgi:hypothetical protein